MYVVYMCSIYTWWQQGGKDLQGGKDISTDPGVCQVFYSVIFHCVPLKQSLTQPEVKLEANKQPEILLFLSLLCFLLHWSYRHIGQCPGFCETSQDLNSDPDPCTASTMHLSIFPALELPFILNKPYTLLEQLFIFP